MSIDLQQQIRDNSRDLNVFLRDLKTWTGEVKAKDEALSNGDVPTTAFAAPIRGRVEDPSVKSESDTKATDRQSPVAHNSRPKPRGDPSSTSDKTLGMSVSDVESTRLLSSITPRASNARVRHARRMRIVPCVGSSWDVGQTQKQTALRLFGWTRATLRHISDEASHDEH